MIKPTIPEVAPFIEMYYRMEGHEMGGSLHIVLEDQNVANHNVEWCREYALRSKDYFGAALANILLRMSTSQRWRLSHRAWGPFADPTWAGGGSWLWRTDREPDIVAAPLTVRGPVEQTMYLLPIRFAEPPEGGITRICSNCLRTDTLVAWDEERWGFHCVDALACFNYLQERRNAT